MSVYAYFAYGSNLDLGQMRARCAGARPCGVARLHDHELAFTGYSARWGSAVATVVPAPGASVRGLVYELNAEDLAALDDFEGHPHVYARVARPVTLRSGVSRVVEVYTRAVELRGRPEGAYLEVMARAYRELGFDAEVLRRAAEE